MRGGEDELVVEEVVCMEEAVKMLMEHLVRPALRVRAAQDEKERTVAQQIHTAVILYNYYHRKMFPQLDFADAKEFCVCACVSTGESLLAYLTLVQEREDNSGKEERLSATDIAAVQACEIAVELDASKASPDMEMWPISKVAILLLDPTRKKCLIEYGAITKGVCSIIENEFDAAAGIPHTTSQLVGQESTKKRNFGTLNDPYLLQQLALSEVECRTGVEVDNKKTHKKYTCCNMPQDDFPTEAPYVDPVMKNGALIPQNVEVAEKSGGITENNDDQVYDSLRSVRKLRDEIFHKGRIIQERCAQCDMDIQIILNGNFRATVHLECPDFEISTTGDPRMTPREAMRSAALNMIIELHRKGAQEQQDN
ncbi:hypothetical protein ACQ4PT_065344 [Festuca glaucescens]